MATLNILLPDDLKEYVDGRVESGAYDSPEEYVVTLIHKDSKRWRKLSQEELDALLLEGIKSMEEEGTVNVDDDYWKSHHQRIRAGDFTKNRSTNETNPTR